VGRKRQRRCSGEKSGSLAAFKTRQKSARLGGCPRLRLLYLNVYFASWLVLVMFDFELWLSVDSSRTASNFKLTASRKKHDDDDDDDYGDDNAW